MSEETTKDLSDFKLRLEVFNQMQDGFGDKPVPASIARGIYYHVTGSVKLDSEITSDMSIGDIYNLCERHVLKCDHCGKTYFSKSLYSGRSSNTCGASCRVMICRTTRNKKED